MPSPIVLPSFAAGELSPALHGRVDLAKYQVGLATALNWFIHPFGGASTRAGTAWVGEVVDSSIQSRLIGFQFNQVQTYVLEFSNLKLRVIMNGGYVLESSTNISAITQANPGQITSNGHGLSTGDHVWIDGVSGMTQLNRRRFPATVLNANNFTIPIDTGPYSAYTSGGTVSRVYTVTTPFVTADLALLKFVQSADTLTITHPAYFVRTLTRTAHTSWTLTTNTFTPSTAAPTGFTTSSPGALVGYAITAENDVTGEESRALLGTANTETSTIGWAGTTQNYNIYKLKNGIYGFIGRGGNTGAFTDATITPDVSRTPPQANNPFPNAGNLPGCSTYHDGRQWYGRTDNAPQTLFASQSAAFNNMDISTPSEDSDAITRTIASREVNEIRFLMSLDQLLVFTSGAVWKGWAGDTVDVITPANFNVKTQTAEGVAQVPPIATEDSAIYVTVSGKKVRDLTYDGRTYKGRNLSILSSHLFEGKTIAEWTYARDPDGLIWCVRSDGILLCFTYLREHDVYAWTRCTTDGFVESVAAIQENNETILYLSVRRTIGGQTKRYVERMASRFFASIYDAWCVDSGYSVNGWNTDTTKSLTISGATYNTGDTVTLTATGHTPFSTPGSIGQKYILRSGQNQVTVTAAAFTSSSVVSATLDYAPHTSLQNVAITDWAAASLTLSGLWHLEGRQVKVFADGSVMDGDFLVSQGTVTLPRAAGRILAGLSYVCDLETLDIEVQPTLQSRQKRVAELTIRVKDTRGLSAGPTSDRLVEFKERTTEAMGYPTQMETGDEQVLIDPLWNSNGRVFLRQAFPLPASVVAIIPRMEAGP